MMPDDMRARKAELAHCLVHYPRQSDVLVVGVRHKLMAESGRRQFVKYNFFKVDSTWRRLPKEQKTEQKEEFAAVVDETDGKIFTRCFSLIGLRGDADFLLWQAADDLETIQDAATQMWSTGLGGYMTQPYSYLSMTRRSQYITNHQHAGQEGTSTRLRPGKAEYFVH